MKNIVKSFILLLMLTANAIALAGTVALKSESKSPDIKPILAPRDAEQLANDLAKDKTFVIFCQAITDLKIQYVTYNSLKADVKLAGSNEEKIKLVSDDDIVKNFNFEDKETMLKYENLMQRCFEQLRVDYPELKNMKEEEVNAVFLSALSSSEFKENSAVFNIERDNCYDDAKTELGECDGSNDKLYSLVKGLVVTCIVSSFIAAIGQVLWNNAANADSAKVRLVNEIALLGTGCLGISGAWLAVGSNDCNTRFKNNMTFCAGRYPGVPSFAGSAYEN